jgi:hypothetical protein
MNQHYAPASQMMERRVPSVSFQVIFSMYYVYLLKLSNGSIYTGCTPDLKRRLKEHQDGKAASTKKF